MKYILPLALCFCVIGADNKHNQEHVSYWPFFKSATIGFITGATMKAGKCLALNWITDRLCPSEKLRNEYKQCQQNGYGYDRNNLTKTITYILCKHAYRYAPLISSMPMQTALNAMCKGAPYSFLDAHEYTAYARGVDAGAMVASIGAIAIAMKYGHDTLYHQKYYHPLVYGEAINVGCGFTVTYDLEQGWQLLPYLQTCGNYMNMFSSSEDA